MTGSTAANLNADAGVIRQHTAAYSTYLGGSSERESACGRALVEKSNRVCFLSSGLCIVARCKHRNLELASKTRLESMHVRSTPVSDPWNQKPSRRNRWKAFTSSIIM